MSESLYCVCKVSGSRSIQRDWLSGPGEFHLVVPLLRQRVICQLLERTVGFVQAPGQERSGPCTRSPFRLSFSGLASGLERENGGLLHSSMARTHAQSGKPPPSLQVRRTRLRVLCI